MPEPKTYTPFSEQQYSHGEIAVLHSEVALLKELLLTRMNAMDKAVDLFQQNLTRVPTDVDRQIATVKELFSSKLQCMEEAEDELRKMSGKWIDAGSAILHLRELCEEKFASIAIQFRERDTRSEQTQKDSKVAVDTALQAAKESVGEQNKSSALAIAKSEASTSKNIDQIGVMIGSTNTATTDKIDDIKQRLTLLEGRGQGAGYIIGSVGVLLGLVVGAATVAVMFIKH